jgi:hypothetical protein
MFRYRHPEIRQEEDSPRWGRVLGAFFGAIVIAIILSAWGWTAYNAREASLRPSHEFPEQKLGPRREIGMIHEELFDEARPGQTLFKEQREALGRFGVVDPSHGVVSIPIDDAIQLLVKEKGR